MCVKSVKCKRGINKISNHSLRIGVKVAKGKNTTASKPKTLKKKQMSKSSEITKKSLGSDANMHVDWRLAALEFWDAMKVTPFEHYDKTQTDANAGMLT